MGVKGFVLLALVSARLEHRGDLHAKRACVPRRLMQINELLVAICPVSRPIQRTLHTVGQLILDLDSEVVGHVLRHNRLTVGELAIPRRKHVVLFRDDTGSLQGSWVVGLRHGSLLLQGPLRSCID